MSTEWMDNLLNNKISKEAMESQGTDKQNHFERKVLAHDWIKGVSDLDPAAVEAEYQIHLKQEAMMLGKTAALDDVIADGTTPEEIVNHDYNRDVVSLSDYALAEMLAEARGHDKQNTSEMFYELKEKAKAEVASSREKAEKALLDMIPESTMLDWQKAFKNFTKDATPAEPKDKDLFASDVPEKAHDFEHPSEDKFKLPKDADKAIPGNGREADERKDVTAEAGVLQKDIVAGTSKEASLNVVAKSRQKLNELQDAGKCTECEQDKPKTQKDQIKCNKCINSKEASLKTAADCSACDMILSDPSGSACANCGAEKGADGKVTHKKADAAVDNNMAMREAFKQTMEGVGEDVLLDLVMQYMPEDDMQSLLSQFSDQGEFTPEVEHYEHAGIPMAVSFLKFKFNKIASACPICSATGKDLKNGQKEHMACEACGLTYARATLHTSEIKSQASKVEVIKKVAELQKTAEVASPWIVTTDEQGNEMIARVETAATNTKESEDNKIDDLLK